VDIEIILEIIYSFLAGGFFSIFHISDSNLSVRHHGKWVLIAAGLVIGDLRGTK